MYEKFADGYMKAIHCQMISFVHFANTVQLILNQLNKYFRMGSSKELPFFIV